MNFKDQLKSVLSDKNMTMTHLVKLLNEKYDRNDSIQNLANKIRKETIRYNEVLEIVELLDFTLQWIPNKNELNAHQLLLRHEIFTVEEDGVKTDKIFVDLSEIRKLNRSVRELADRIYTLEQVESPPDPK